MAALVPKRARVNPKVALYGSVTRLLIRNKTCPHVPPMELGTHLISLCMSASIVSERDSWVDNVAAEEELEELVAPPREGVTTFPLPCMCGRPMALRMVVSSAVDRSLLRYSRELCAGGC